STAASNSALSSAFAIIASATASRFWAIRVFRVRAAASPAWRRPVPRATMRPTAARFPCIIAVMKRVLVVLDPTAEEQPALQRAAWLARHLPAELELFVCEYD